MEPIKPPVIISEKLYISFNTIISKLSSLYKSGKSVDFFIVLSQTHFLKQYLIFPHVVDSQEVIYIFRILGP